MIPRSALVLGLAGLIPFVWGAFSQLVPALGDWGTVTLGPRFVGPYVSLSYGIVILAFMSGVLWGFSTHAKAQAAAIGYGLSVLPALWAFLFVGGGPDSAARWLAAGFVGLLGLDYVFWRQGLAPNWWMHLRLMLTAGVVTCLVVPMWI
jgi:hypothetical protein